MSVSADKTCFCRARQGVFLVKRVIAESDLLTTAASGSAFCVLQSPRPIVLSHSARNRATIHIVRIGVVMSGRCVNCTLRCDDHVCRHARTMYSALTVVAIYRSIATRTLVSSASRVRRK